MAATDYAYVTARTLDRGAINQIATFLRGSAKLGAETLSAEEREELVRTADGLERILSWAEE